MINVGNQNNYSLLSYLGSKFTICHDVINYFPKHKIFVDAFGGAGNILINKPRSQVEIYNDVYNEVVNLFEVIRSKELCQAFFKAVKRTPYAEIEYINAYNNDDTIDKVEKARRLLIRSNFSFHPSGVFAKNSFRFAPQKNLTKGSGNSKWKKLPAKIAELHNRFTGVTITNKSALDFLKSKHFNRSDCLIYCDPPYVNDVSKTSNEYEHNFTDGQHAELMELASNTEAMVAVSGYKNDIYEKYLLSGKGWRRIDIMMPYTFNATLKRSEILEKRQITECLYLNRNAVIAYDAEYRDRIFKRPLMLF